MRAESDKPMANGGWLHKPDKPVPVTYKPKPEPPKPKLDWSRMLARWKAETEHDRLADFADKLGVGADTLQVTGCVWAHQYRAWAWPMRTGGGLVCGVRLRNEDGDKWAVKGSAQGLFLPWPMPAKLRRLYVVEGPTDLCAALTIGLPAVGRPQCRGCVEPLLLLLARLSVTETVVIADRDEAGQQGAIALQEALPVQSKLWTPAAKDLREAVKRGLTSSVLDNCLRDLEWTDAERNACIK